MKRNCLIILVLCVAAFQLEAQSFLSRNGTVSFYSDAAMEKIEAHNHQVITKMDVTTGQMSFAILIKAFQFEKQLMQQQFNQDYLESQTYPKASFQGKIQNLNNINFEQDGTYPITVRGILNLHGVSREVEEKGTITVGSGQIRLNAKFWIVLSDYNVKRPAILKDKIAKDVLVEVNTVFN